MKILKISLLSLALAMLSGSAYACTASATPLSPATISTTPNSGALPTGAATQLTINCSAGETYSISTSTSFFRATVGGSVSNKIEGVWFIDAAFTQPLYWYPINGTAAATGAITTTLYARLSGLGGGYFSDDFGAFSFEMTGSVTSSGGTPISLALTEAGTVNGVCSVNNAAVDFGNVASGSKPILPVGIVVNCTSGVPWSMSQTAVAPVTIGANTNNTAWIYSDAGASSALYTSPVLGTGIGVGQNQSVPVYVGLSGATMGSGIQGAGQINGSIPIMVNY